MNFEENLHQIAKQNNFLPIHNIRYLPKSGYFIILGKQGKRDVILRTSPISDHEKILRLEKEDNFSQIVEAYNKENHDQIRCIKVLSTGKTGDIFWSLREYRNEDTLAEEIDFETEELHNFDKIRMKFVKNYSTILNNIIKNSVNLRKIDNKLLSGSQDGMALFPQRNKKDIRQYNIARIEKFLSLKLDRQIEFYEQTSTDYFLEQNLSVVTGDLTPSNILISDKNKATFFDFEWACVDNYQFDQTYLWLYLWRYGDWQQKIMGMISKSEKDKNFFRATVIRELIAWFEDAFSITNQNDLNRRIKFYKNHIWSRYLFSAGESFEAIMRVK